MQQSLSHRWAHTVLARRWWVLAAWLLFALVIRLAAPSWNDVAYDGAFLAAVTPRYGDIPATISMRN